MLKRRRLDRCVLVVLLLGACGPSTEEGGQQTDAPSETAEVTDVEPSESPASPPPPDVTDTLPPGTPEQTPEPTQPPTSEPVATAAPVPSPDPSLEPTPSPPPEVSDYETQREPTETPEGYHTGPPPTESPTPCASPQGPSYGMTYGWGATDLDAGTVSVGCYTADGSCDPYQGDLACSEVRPILCIRPDGSAPPSPALPRWVGGPLATTPPIRGDRMTSREEADRLCRDTWGEGWRMAEYHDSPDGPSFVGYGLWESDLRMWVAINDQAANCWNKPRCEDVASRTSSASHPPRAPEGAKGMSWGWASTDTAQSLVRMSCYGQGGSCDPYQGDVTCDTPLPLLCLQPSETTWGGPSGVTDWVNARIGATPPLRGSRFSTLTDADSMCARTFGSGWRVAEWHDNPSGSSLTAEGRWISDARMWVDINDQPATCWARPVD